MQGTTRQLQLCNIMLFMLGSGTHLFTLQVRDRDEEDVPVRRFCTVVWGPGGRDGMSTTLVMLDAQGGLQDMLFCTHLSGALRRGRDFDASSYQQHIAMDPQKVG